MQKIIAPFDGWCAPLDEVPDEVFAGRMLGDGLAIDPTSGIVLAPCGGEIVTLPDSAHAVSIRSPDGLEVLIHIGIDTVRLGGKGFDARVKPGAQVRAGEELIRFDLDLVARGAKSLITPIVVTSDGTVVANRRAPGAVRAGELLFQVEGASLRTGSVAGSADLGARAERVIAIALLQGLHARPAALLARRAKGVAASITLRAHGRATDARSVVGIMALGVRHGDELSIQAEGAAAPQAVAEILAALEEAQGMDSAHAAVSVSAPQPAQRAARPGEITGVCAVPGFAVGRATRIERREMEVVEQGSGRLHEQAELERARTNVKLRLERVRNAGGTERREIIGAHLEFLDDPGLKQSANELIALGKSAGFAWRSATRRSIAALESLERCAPAGTCRRSVGRRGPRLVCARR